MRGRVLHYHMWWWRGARCWLKMLKLTWNINNCKHFVNKFLDYGIARFSDNSAEICWRRKIFLLNSCQTIGGRGSPTALGEGRAEHLPTTMRSNFAFKEIYLHHSGPAPRNWRQDQKWHFTQTAACQYSVCMPLIVGNIYRKFSELLLLYGSQNISPPLHYWYLVSNLIEHDGSTITGYYLKLGCR